MTNKVALALVAARQNCWNEDDAYWIDGQPQFTEPINPRNEAAALSQLLAKQGEVCGTDSVAVLELHTLCNSYCERTGAQQEAGPSGRPFGELAPESALLKWARSKGMSSCLVPATFRMGGSSSSSSATGSGAAGEDGSSGGLRGLMPDREVAPGDVVLTLPSSLLISYDTARDSDLGKALQRIPSLDPESLALIWTMAERCDAESEMAPYWASLPSSFSTGLSAGEEVVGRALPPGTAVHQEVARAREHMATQFQALSPVFEALCKAYSAHLQPHMFTWEAFLWAAELWYAYAIQVQFPDGVVRPCLVPYVGLINHSPHPHVVHFSRVDPESGCLRLRAFRSCAAGRQLFISYGPLPNPKLLLFYGFSVPHNPFDAAPLMLALPDGQRPARQSILQAAGLDLAGQRVRGGGRGLPPDLLACVRLLAASKKEVQGLQKRKGVAAELRAPLSKDTERAALQLLRDTLARELRAMQGETGSTGSAAGQATQSSAGAGQGGGSPAAAAAAGDVHGTFLQAARVVVTSQVQMLQAALTEAEARLSAL